MILVRNFSRAFPRRQSEKILIDVGLVNWRKLSNIMMMIIPLSSKLAIFTLLGRYCLTGPGHHQERDVTRHTADNWLTGGVEDRVSRQTARPWEDCGEERRGDQTQDNIMLKYTEIQDCISLQGNYQTFTLISECWSNKTSSIPGIDFHPKEVKMLRCCHSVPVSQLLCWNFTAKHDGTPCKVASFQSRFYTEQLWCVIASRRGFGLVLYFCCNFDVVCKTMSS